jgi:hypothetical protein
MAISAPCYGRLNTLLCHLTGNCPFRASNPQKSAVLQARRSLDQAGSRQKQAHFLRNSLFTHENRETEPIAIASETGRAEPALIARRPACVRVPVTVWAPVSRANGGTHGWQPKLRQVLGLRGGAGGIRTLDTLLAYTHFPGERLRPLGHRSACTGLARPSGMAGIVQALQALAERLSWRA